MADVSDDIMIFETEDGGEQRVQYIDSVFYNGDEYAVMTELAEGQEPWTEEGGDEEYPEIFFMKVVPVDDENVEFEPVDDELGDKLFEIVNSEFEDEIDDEE